MAQGISINIGLNAVDPAHYQGWSGPLLACEFDAADMAMIAEASGLSATTIMTADATRDRVIATIRKATAKLRSGDMLMITYSGHGGQLPDKNAEEDDSMDETWCLFDGELIDDEIYQLISEAADGVRVLVFSDSCHSGTVAKARILEEDSARMRGASAAGAAGGSYRAMPPDIVTRTYLANRTFYDKVLAVDRGRASRVKTKAACILISGCQDNQLSGDGNFNGVFTGQLKSVWNGGKFRGNYVAFWRAIVRRMPPDQTPNFFSFGKNVDRFSRQRPFQLNTPGAPRN